MRENLSELLSISLTWGFKTALTACLNKSFGLKKKEFSLKESASGVPLVSSEAL